MNKPEQREGFFAEAEFPIRDAEGLIRKYRAVVFVPLEKGLKEFEGKRGKCTFEILEEAHGD